MMNIPRVFVFVQFLTAITFGMVLGSFQDGFAQSDDQGHVEATSLLDAYITNLEEIRSYDLVMRNESTWIANDELLVQEKIAYVRVVVDPEKNRCLAVQRVLKKLVAGSPKPEADQPNESVFVAMLSNGEGWIRQIPDRGLATVRAEPKRETVLRFTDEVPCLQFLGFAKFPLPYISGVDNLAKTNFAAYRGGIYSLSFDGKSNIGINPPGKLLRSSIDFDVFNLVPKSFVITSGESKRRVCSESFQFEVRNGLKLPIRVTGESVQSVEVGGKVVKGVKQYHADIRWFSANESLSDEYFDLGLLKDTKKLLTFVTEELVYQK